MAKERKKPTELFDLDVFSLGLVESGANERSFYFFKKRGGKKMDVREELEELKEAETVDRSVWERLIGVLQQLGWSEKEEKKTPPEIAAGAALQLLEGFSSEEALKEAIKELADVAGLPVSSKEAKEGKDPKKAVREALKLLYPFMEVSALQRAIRLLASYVGYGYPYPYPYPKPKAKVEEEQEAKVEEEQEGKLEKKLRRAEEEIAQLREANLKKELEALSREVGGYPVEKLMKLRKSLPEEDFSDLVDELKLAQEKLESGLLFKELGSAAEAEVPSAGEACVSKAEELVKEEKISFSEALKKVAASEPGLYEQYLEERGG